MEHSRVLATLIILHSFMFPNSNLVAQTIYIRENKSDKYISPNKHFVRNMDFQVLYKSTDWITWCH